MIKMIYEALSKGQELKFKAVTLSLVMSTGGLT